MIIGIACCCFFILPGMGKMDLQRVVGFFSLFQLCLV